MLDMTSIAVHRPCSSATSNISVTSNSMGQSNEFSTSYHEYDSQPNVSSVASTQLVSTVNDNSDIESDSLWTTFCAKNGNYLPDRASSNQSEVRENLKTRKRKFTFSNRAAFAAKYLKEHNNNITKITAENNWNSETNTSHIKDIENQLNEDTDSTDSDIEIKIDNKDNTAMKNIDNNESGLAWDNVDENLNDEYIDQPYYMIGFPNPPGENRCWLNATLHALFVLPLIDYLNNYYLNDCSRLTKTLVTMQIFWKQGAQEREKTYQTLKKFKDELRILDESYSSKKQQDVSEFLMIFLNYVRSECERLIAEENFINSGMTEAENIPNNQSQLAIDTASVHTLLTPKKRGLSPASSPLKEINNLTNDSSAHSNQTSYPFPSKPSKTSNAINPVDEIFLLHMIEHYVCQGCNKHREKHVDNLMLYVDLPNGDNGVIDLTELIAKSMEPEERNFGCVRCKYNKHHVSTVFRGCPNVLIVQINRYGMVEEGIVEKINAPVEIPSVLQINSEPGNTIYNFQPVCIITHVGTSMDYGHYTSYVNHASQWFHYNDMDVTPMTEREALDACQTTAYLVFFVESNLLDKLNFVPVNVNDDSLR